MNNVEALKLLIKARELGITDADIETFKAKLAPEVVPELKPEEIVKPISVLDEFSEEEIQFYATPYFDELQEKKRLHQEKIKEQPA